jgi:hypothetical protein
MLQQSNNRYDDPLTMQWGLVRAAPSLQRQSHSARGDQPHVPAKVRRHRTLAKSFSKAFAAVELQRMG